MRTTKELSNILSSNKCEYSDRKEAAFELLTNGKKFTINRAARKLSNVIIQLGLKGGVYGQVTPVMSECTEAMIILGPSSVKPFINVINN